MGTLTLTNLKSEIRSHLGGRTDLNDRLVTALNIAQIQLARVHDFEELQDVGTISFPFTGVTATDMFIQYSVLGDSDPREFYSISLVDGTNSRKLVRKTVRQFDQLIPDPTRFALARPQIYVTWKTRLELWPIPDQAYTGVIRWSKWPAVFTEGAPNAVSEFRQKDDILLYMAVSYLYHSLGEYERAKMFFGFAKNHYDTSIKEDRERPDTDISPVSSFPVYNASYWSNPFVRSVV